MDARYSLIVDEGDEPQLNEKRVFHEVTQT